MNFVLRFVFLVSTSVWVGGIAFFSFGVAPRLFAQFPRGEAGDIVGTLFPVYYASGCGAGVLSVLAAFSLWWRGGERLWLTVLLSSALMLGASAYAATVVHPRAAALREKMKAEPAAEGGAPAEFGVAFASLHRSAVRLNGFVLAAGLANLALVASRIRP
ncbi:MAG: hypothetical protein KatS3mg076_0134 [Candidatus Binatia bacterium]|nr:MAG: hypothetical protein KatS3mg076_0134 [Candidatus Binatia bacterium]